MTGTLLHVPAAEGRPLLEGRMQLKVASDQVNDAYTLCLGKTPPGLGPPLHLHELDDQTHYVLNGTYELICGADVVTVGEGACAHMPRYMPHTFRNAGPEPAVLIEFTAPGGIDRYFDAVAHLGPYAVDVDARNEVGRPYGISFPDDPEAYVEPPPGEVRRPAKFVLPSEGRRIDGSGCDAIMKVDAADTGGTHTLTEYTLTAGEAGRLSASGPLAVVGLEGALVVDAGDEHAEVTRGDCVALLSAGCRVTSPDGSLARFLVYATETGR